MANNNNNNDIVGQTVQLLACELKGHHRAYQPSIFKVPTELIDISPESYIPQVVSIGPLHRAATHVQAFEARKATYLNDLLGWLDLPHEPTLEECVQKVTGSINYIKQSYNEMVSYTDVELAHMMVMDGFFILEFIYKVKDKDIDSFLGESIMKDLLKLENQIPFFVLQDLFDCTILKCRPSASLTDLVLDALQVVSIFVQDPRNEIDIPRPGTTPDHILGLLHTKKIYSIRILKFTNLQC
ncbi:UPF0481 protein At3g47200-like [Rutidosis leptorrhynchoides]|uniref:UPF0481 protein At3g47200-like n=1 Tax=Rutidosis leptorrhynchoides TaxID=125765 RepID=UPI003A9923B7